MSGGVYPTVFSADPDGWLYVGGRSGNPQVSNGTILRGANVKIFAHGSGKVYLYATGSGGGVYLGESGSTAVTSDETLKDLWEIDSRYEDFFMHLHPTLYRYKRSGHRSHIGYGARAVEQALAASNLSTEEFAGLVIEKDVTIPAEMAHTDSDQFYDELYSLRYEEFGPLYAHMLQKAIRRLDALEAQVYQ